MKKILVLSGMLILMLCFGFAHAADFKMTSDVDCSGDCSVKQTYNGESVEVVSSGKTRVTTHANDGKAEMTIDSIGQGEVTMNLNNGDYSNLKVNVNGEGSGETGGHRINTTFNSRENLPKIPRNLTPDEGNTSEDNETEAADSDNNDSIYDISDNNTCSRYGTYAACSAQDGFEASTYKVIEVNNDGNVEKTETDGVFQKIYKFFQSFTAKIFWG